MELRNIPPQDLEAEQAVLGCMLTDNESVYSALEILRPEDFYREDHKIIFEAISNIYNKTEPVDIITLKSELSSMGKFDAVGGLEYIASLPEKVPTTANVEKYIKLVEEKAMLRELIKTADEIKKLGFEATDNVEDIMDNAEKQIFNVMERKNQRGYTSIKDILVGAFTELEKLYNRKGQITGVPSGFTELDKKIAGFHGSELILIAARPGMGKTAFALNIATNAALRAKKPVAIFSLEMSKEQLANRILSSESLVNSENIRKGTLNDEEWGKLAETSGMLSEAPIYVDDSPGLTVLQIMAKARKLKLEKKIELIVIDYLQLITGNSKRNGSREQEIAEISRSLKLMAKEIGVPVIALSQLSRAVEGRVDHKPMLSDLRESGSIEQDADVVMFIYREDYYDKETEKKGIATIDVAKQRSGSTGAIELIWLPQFTKFANLEKYREGN